MYPTPIDLSLAAWFHSHATPGVTRAMLLITDMNSNLAVELMSAALALILLKQRQRDWLITLILTVPTGLAINALLKNLFALPRPQFEDPIVKLETYSFPSGHVAGVTLFYGFVVAYLWQLADDPRLRALYAAVATMLVVLVAFTRVYLGAHYLTDVIGGAVWSLGWLALCLRLRSRWLAR
jgi:membrane-associated phospholipid phosphatase